jgi:hypothetical protein
MAEIAKLYVAHAGLAGRIEVRAGDLTADGRAGVGGATRARILNDRLAGRGVFVLLRRVRYGLGHLTAFAAARSGVCSARSPRGGLHVGHISRQEVPHESCRHLVETSGMSFPVKILWYFV